MLHQMAWLSPGEENETKILHLRLAPHEPWRPYNTFSQYAVPDYPIQNGSRGFATFQKLIKAGWELVPSHQMQQLSLVQYSKSA